MWNIGKCGELVDRPSRIYELTDGVLEWASVKVMRRTEYVPAGSVLAPNILIRHRRINNDTVQLTVRNIASRLITFRPPTATSPVRAVVSGVNIAKGMRERKRWLRE